MPASQYAGEGLCWHLTAAWLLDTDVGGGDTGGAGAEPDDMFDLDDL